MRGMRYAVSLQSEAVFEINKNKPILMTPKAFIEDLQGKRSNYSDPDQANNQANSIDSLSTDIYTDRKRFLFELLQNADDASTKFDKLEVHFIYSGNWIIVSHCGEPFSDIDIESIASVGDGNKQGDENKTGFKGIGFKSVFSHSDKVVIYSKDYCFSFDRSKWASYWNEKWGDKAAWEESRRAKGKTAVIKMPWQIIPIWTEIGESNAKNLSNYSVSTFIHYDDISSLKGEVKELFSESNILLFLRCSNAKIVIHDEGQHIIEKISLEDGRVKILQNGASVNEWLMKHFQFSIDSDVKQAIHNDLKIPRKLKESVRTEISIAFPIHKDKIQKLEEANRLVFSYLPTSVNYNFPFLVNGSFITDAGRQHLHEDTVWNQWLFERIPHLLFFWLGEIAQEKNFISKQILEFVPSPFSGGHSLKQAFNRGLKKALDSIAFLPSQDGTLLRATDAILDVDEWCQVLGQKFLIDFLNDGNSHAYSVSSFIEPLKPISKLKEIGVLIPNSETIIKFFESEAASDFIEDFRDSNAKLVEIFFNQTRKLTGDDFHRWSEKIRSIPFILDTSDKFRTPAELFFPSAQYSTNLNSETPIMRGDIFAELETRVETIDWLRSLGIQEVFELSFIEKVLILKSDTYITPENAIELGRYLFDTYKRGELTPFFLQIQGFPLLTIEGSLKPANQLFLSDFYSPVTPMQESLKEDIYCSPDYVDSRKELKAEWKIFLLKMGVKEKMVLETIEGNKLTLTNKLKFKSDFFIDKVNSYGYYKFKIVRISFIEKAIDNHQFAKLFWLNTLNIGEISTAQIKYNSETRAFWGFKDMPGALYGDEYESYIEWIFKIQKILPTTQGKCVKQGAAFINTPDIKEVAGKYLPVFDCDYPVPPDWKEYLGFKTQLQLADYLTVLRGIWQEETEDETERKANRRKIYKIYEALLAMLSSMHLSQKEEIKQWGQSNKLLSTINEFYYPSELYLINVQDFQASADYKTIVKTDRSAPSMLELMRLIGVNIVENKRLKTSNDIVQITSLKSKLLETVPLLNLIRLKDRELDWAEGIEYLESKLGKLKCFKTSEIEIAVECGEETITQTKRALLDNYNLFYKGGWENPLTLDFIVSEIQSYIGLKKTDKHILNTLLLISHEEGLEYLNELGFDISIIPEDIEIVPEPAPISPNTGGGYNKTKEEIGLLGEQFTFQELKRIFIEKYQKDPIPTDTGFEIPGCVNVVWKNISGVSMADHDFFIEDGDKAIYLDAKATTHGEGFHTEYQLTSAEFDLMKDADTYVIARVFNVGEDFEKAGTYLRFISMGLFDFSATLAASNSY